MGLLEYSEIFTVSYTRYYAPSGKVSWILDVYFRSYEVLSETALLLSAEIQILFELLWDIGLAKTYDIFTVNFWVWLKNSCKVLWILDL